MTTALFVACKALCKPAFDYVIVEITSSILQLPFVPEILNFDCVAHSLAVSLEVEALVTD